MNWYRQAVFHDFTSGGFSNYNTEVHLNPSIWEFHAMGPARVIVDPNNGNVYAASDAESTHFDIRQTLDGIVGVEGFAYIQGENVLFNLRVPDSDRLIKLIQQNIPNAITNEGPNALV